MVCSFVYSQRKPETPRYLYNTSIKFGNLNKTDSAYLFMLKAKDSYLSLKNYDSVFLCNLKLFDFIGWQPNLKKDRLTYLNENKNIKTKDTVLILALSNRYAIYYFNQKTPRKSATHFHQSIFLSEQIKRNDYKSNAFINLGLLYSEKFKDSANLYLNKALGIIPSTNTNKFVSIYINLINLYQKQLKFNKSIKLLKITDKLILNHGKLKYKKIIYRKFAQCYRGINNFEKAYKYQSKYLLYKDSLDVYHQNIAINELDKKYKTAEKDKLIILSETKRKQSQNLFYGTLVFLFLVGTTGFLFLKNSKKKRLLAEQQKELEKQKNLTLLKEQEIMAINAMIKGQEKERIRIAEDLHDNIGSVLATLKLHFENLKLNREKKHFNQDKLYEKTENLIDETYLKVRSIAHAKNGGVIANKGLLVAIKIMAEKISDANKIDIHVLDFGLNKRLDNNLEITIFRLIQELITNIIKHANATEATINISLFDKNLNIIVEDNGKGFNYNKTTLKEGMGINSIQTRIKYLKGTFNVDSTISKGTSIIMDIPVI